MSDTPQTLFVKDETGKVHGPLTFSAVGQLVASGTLQGRIQMSVDGFQYADPGKYPNLRDLFPRSMWGQTSAVTDAPVRPAIPRPPSVGTHVTNASSAPRAAAPAAASPKPPATPPVVPAAAAVPRPPTAAPVAPAAAAAVSRPPTAAGAAPVAPAAAVSRPPTAAGAAPVAPAAAVSRPPAAPPVAPAPGAAPVASAAAVPRPPTAAGAAPVAPVAPAAAAAPKQPTAPPAAPAAGAAPATPTSSTTPTTAPVTEAVLVSAPVGASVVQPEAASTTTLSEADQATVRELRERLEATKKQDHFAVLGLGQDASGGHVKMAYFKLARTLHPDTVPQGAPPEILKLKSDLFAAVGEAYRRLADDNARAQYLQELKSGTAGEEQVDVNRLFLAEELFTKGSIMVKARKFTDAVKMLTDAIAANPDEAEYYAWRAAAKFYAGVDKRASYADAQRDLDDSTKRNPKCAQAFYFHGQMHKLLGDNPAALKLFKKTLELNKDHLEAQREVRLLEGKK